MTSLINSELEAICNVLSTINLEKYINFYNVYNVLLIFKKFRYNFNN